MRQIENFNYKWAFTKEAKELPTDIPSSWYFVNLPHTWNNIDGQDGGNDYYRGTCYYAKKFDNVEWVYNSTSNDEVAIKLTLSISQDDFKTIVTTDENNLTDFTRSTFINEIGLCIANVNPNTGEINQNTIELVTKLCFASEVYFNPLKSSILEYYIYA